MKMCEQILQKRHPNTNQIFRTVKNHDVLNNSRYRFPAIKHTRQIAGK